MKGFFILLFCFYSLLSFSQKKKEYFYDEDFNRVSKEEFDKKIDHKYNLPKVVENDTAIIGKLVYKKVYGKLEEKDKKLFFELLNKTVNNQIDSTQTILLNFIYEGEGNVIHYFEHKRKVFKFFKKPKNRLKYNQFFITEKGFRAKSKRINLHEDVYDLLPRLFLNIDLNLQGM